MQHSPEKSGIVTAEASLYIEAIKSMPNEVLVAHSLEKEIRKQILELRSNFEQKPKVVYYCCGPCPILHDKKDLQNFLAENSDFTGIDLNSDYIKFNKASYPSLRWQAADAIAFKQQNQISILNSSYHHIPDELKLAFLKNIANNLTLGGAALMGENFLPFYAPQSRYVSVNQYYDSLIQDYQRQDPAPVSAIRLLQSARQNDLTHNGEFKNHIWEFLEHLEQVGLQLCRIERVWPVSEVLTSDRISQDFFGSSLFVLQKM
jgi:trans-aconitate methyltransferase